MNIVQEKQKRQEWCEEAFGGSKTPGQKDGLGPVLGQWQNTGRNLCGRANR
jgi:hypothetical protein